MNIQFQQKQHLFTIAIALTCAQYASPVVAQEMTAQSVNARVEAGGQRAQHTVAVPSKKLTERYREMHFSPEIELTEKKRARKKVDSGILKKLNSAKQQLRLSSLIFRSTK